MSRSHLVRAISDWLDERTDLTAPVLILVPRTQVGAEIRSALLLDGCSLPAVRFSTPKMLATQVLSWKAPERRLEGLSPAVSSVLVEILLAQIVPPEDPLSRSAASISSTLLALGDAGVEPSAVAREVQGPFAGALAEIHDAWRSKSRALGLIDDHTFFGLAEQALQDAPLDQLPARALLLGETTVSPPAGRFLERLAEAVGDASILELRSPAGSTARPDEASARLGGSPAWQMVEAGGLVVGQASPVESDQSASRVLYAVGAETAIRAAIRTIAEERIPFEEVEIAYTRREPYLSLASGVLGSLSVPATFAAGIAAPSAADGSTLIGFLRWIADGLPSQGLADLLREGHFRLPKAGPSAAGPSKVSADSDPVAAGPSKVSADSDPVAAGDTSSTEDCAATALEAIRAGDSVGRYAAALRSDLDAAVSSGILEVIRLVPRGDVVSVGSLVRTLEAVLKRCMATQSPGGAEAALRAELQTRLREIASALGNEVAPRARLATRLARDLTGMYLQARAASPGAVHVVPLSSAGFSSRRVLMILGMEQASFAETAGEDALLSDADRQRLSAELSLRSAARGRNARLLDLARARHGRDLRLIVNLRDMATDREHFPARAVGEASDSQDSSIEKAPRHTFLAVGTGARGIALCEAEVGLGGDPVDFGRSSGRPSWIERRIGARGVMEGPDWSPLDGQLAAGVPLFAPGETVSPSRLETVVACPYRYFLRYVLGLKPPEIRDPDQWLSPMEKGSLIHAVLEDLSQRRMEDGGDWPGDAATESLIARHLDKTCARAAPPHPAAVLALRSELTSAVRYLIREGRRTVGVEVSFGGEDAPIELQLGEMRISIRGRIDAVERIGSGALAITDYKSGSAFRFSGGDLLAAGQNLQWALYALAAEQLLGEPVVESGYLFVNQREQGLRLASHPPAAADVGEALAPVALLAEKGLFPRAIQPYGQCRYCDFRRVCGDLSSRKSEVTAKVAATVDAGLARALASLPLMPKAPKTT